MNKNDFIKYCRELGIVVTSEMMDKLNTYYELLTSWNEKFNLTTIIKAEDVYLKHFYDSLCIVKTGLINNENIKLCDFGTGAGFPGIVLKIVFPNIDTTLIESNGKKCMFLENVVNTLNLKDIKVINERTEVYAKDNRELFDIVTCRAVSSLKIITELSVPMLKINGYFIPLKGKVEDEIKESEFILKELDSYLKEIISYNLPIESSVRNIIVIKKLKETSKKYPREYNQIAKK